MFEKYRLALANPRESPLSCRFFIRGEPPNKNAAVLSRVLTQTHAEGSSEITRRFPTHVLHQAGGFRSTIVTNKTFQTASNTIATFKAAVKAGIVVNYTIKSHEAT
jgi:hypothetical protein